MTWALFGQARKRDESLINLQSRAAEVSLTFEYEGTVYRIQRTLPRGKTTILEFQVWDQDAWRPLTERTTRDTQERIQQALRLDYDTFINASFFLQGKADQFAQQTASRRKDVLGSVLGLEVWEIYRERTAERRRRIERDLVEIEGRLSEIDAELAEEGPRRARLQELEGELQTLASARLARESTLDDLRKMAASLNEQRRLVETLAAGLERSNTALGTLQARLASKTEEFAACSSLTARAAEIQEAYRAWQAARDEVARLDLVAARFREQDEQRQPLLLEIESERARLVQECDGLELQSEEIRGQAAVAADLLRSIQAAKDELAGIESRLNGRAQLESQAIQARERQAELRVQNEQLRVEMRELKERIDRLAVAQGASCPLCGQPLSEQHRLSTLGSLQEEGEAKGTAYRSNQSETGDLAAQVTALEAEITSLASLEAQRVSTSGTVMQLTERLQNLERRSRDWEQTGARRLAELAGILDQGAYALPAREALATLDAELALLGYDASAHDESRRLELEARGAEEQFRSLEAARQVGRQLEAEMLALQADINTRQVEIAEQQGQYDSAAAALEASQAGFPDLESAEVELLRLRERENQVRDEVGAARQKVEVLGALRSRKGVLSARREESRRLIARHRSLERAFGKDGVPALLIEQALPQIESRANELLDRLSDGQMSIRFVTQAEYKDKKRGDLRETLDIQISDGAGMRDYEMYSGGEAFRVNFAIRLALSEVLAQRKGARLQTLVIDEGFGSQDTRGRQRLVEAINLVREDFAKILVITHLDELKDAFPNRIEVEKTDQGSTVMIS
jgi:exonuclease SbcC